MNISQKAGKIFKRRQPVVLLSGHVEGDKGDETGDLHEEVDQQRHAGVEGKSADGRHVGQGAQKEAVPTFRNFFLCHFKKLQERLK